MLARVKSVGEIFILRTTGKRREMRNPMRPMIHRKLYIMGSYVNLLRKPGSDYSDEPFGANPLFAPTTSRFDAEPFFAPRNRGKTTGH